MTFFSVPLLIDRYTKAPDDGQINLLVKIAMKLLSKGGLKNLHFPTGCCWID